MTLPSQSAGLHLGVFQGFIVTTDQDGMVPLNSRVLATIEPGATQFWIDLLAENSKLKGQLEEAVGALEKVLEVSAFHRSLISEHGFDQTPVEYDATILIAKLKEAGS